MDTKQENENKIDWWNINLIVFLAFFSLAIFQLIIIKITESEQISDLGVVILFFMAGMLNYIKYIFDILKKEIHGQKRS